MTTGDNMVDMRIRLTHPVGLHARPASKFVQTANKFASTITVQNVTTGGDPVDAKSILMVLTLGALQNHEILIRAEGPDSEKAAQDLGDLVRNNFGETEKSS
jgi:phosphotransferase system HPr (HPr) family protein